MEAEGCPSFRNGDPNSPNATHFHRLTWFIGGVPVRLGQRTRGYYEDRDLILFELEKRPDQDNDHCDADYDGQYDIEVLVY